MDMDRFTSEVHKIAEECIPKSSARKKKPHYPWFNQDCKQAIKSRRKALDIFRKFPSSTNCIKYKTTYAKARRTIWQAKRQSWRDYVSRLNTRTSVKKTWDMVRKISGKFSSPPVKYLDTEQGKASSTKEIADALGATFAKNSSSDKYTEKFKHFKEQTERKRYNFTSLNDEDYNLPFTMDELDESLSRSNDSAEGPDDIHYQLIKHLSKSAPKKCYFYLMKFLVESRAFPLHGGKLLLFPFRNRVRTHSIQITIAPLP